MNLSEAFVLGRADQSRLDFTAFVLLNTTANASGLHAGARADIDSKFPAFSEHEDIYSQRFVATFLASPGDKDKNQEIYGGAAASQMSKSPSQKDM